MSRSYRKTPICGMTKKKSDKAFKTAEKDPTFEFVIGLIRAGFLGVLFGAFVVWPIWFLLIAFGVL